MAAVRSFFKGTQFPYSFSEMSERNTSSSLGSGIVH
jgi:hypothetical protein